MKAVFISSIFFSSLFLMPLSAQDCDQYFAFRDGITMEMTNYDAKDKVEGKSIMQVNSDNTTSQNAASTLSISYYDKKGEKLFENLDIQLVCKDRTLSIDRASFNNMFNSMKEVEGMEVDVHGEFLEYPADMKVGDELTEAPYTVTTGMSGINMTVNTTIGNRKVLSEESVTVPAGTYQCYKISYDLITKNNFMNTTMSYEEWYAPEVGMPVKSISYKNNGKIASKSVLTKLTGI